MLSCHKHYIQGKPQYSEDRPINIDGIGNKEANFSEISMVF